MLELIPVVEADSRPVQFEWVAPRTSGAFIELNDRSPDADIASVLALLASYNDIASSGSIEDVAQAVSNAETLVLPGGLLARAESVEIPPGCCCGLEGWREWFGVAPGGSSPWLGHDPSPWVECTASTAIVWADSELGDRSPRVSVPYSQIDSACKSAEADLVAFTARLLNWLSGHSARSADVALRFSKAFDVG